MRIVYAVCNVLFFLPVSVWLGGLVLLAIATQLIERALEKRRTEGRQIVRKLRGLFQRIELIALATTWLSAIAQALLEKAFGEGFPGTFGTADAIKMGMLVVPTASVLYSALYLTGAIKRREAQIGDYGDKNEQIRIRKNLAALHVQAKALVWLNAGVMAALVIVGVLAMD